MPKNKVEEMYKELQTILYKLIPEKWESMYLYASVINGRGEMFFYYFPKKTILKPKPINCYEIAKRFGINEDEYNMALSSLYEKIKELNKLAIRKWSNITISIVNCLFTIEYNYNDIIHSIYSDEERRVFWEYKYLKVPLDSMSKKNQNLVKSFQYEGSVPPFVHTEGIYIQKNNTNEKLEKELSNIVKIKEEEQKEEIEKKEKESLKVRNQILKC